MQPSPNPMQQTQTQTITVGAKRPATCLQIATASSSKKPKDKSATAAMFDDLCDNRILKKEVDDFQISARTRILAMKPMAEKKVADCARGLDVVSAQEQRAKDDSKMNAQASTAADATVSTKKAELERLQKEVSAAVADAEAKKNIARDSAKHSLALGKAKATARTQHESAKRELEEVNDALAIIG